MNDVLAMDIVQRHGDLCAERSRFLDRQRQPGEQRPQGFAGDEFHDPFAVGA